MQYFSIFLLFMALILKFFYIFAPEKKQIIIRPSMKCRCFIRNILCLLACCLIWHCPSPLMAEEETATADTDSTVIDRLAPDFVLASVVIAEPHDILYSSFGHAALRLQCPTFGLDYIFTCEGEPAQDNVTRFLLGDLKMGVYAMKAAAYLEEYAQQGRGVTEYALNLSPADKQRLWQQMDERVKQAHVPYDYVANGCAHLVLEWIDQAYSGGFIHYGAWPATFDQSRKVIAGHVCRQFPWSHLVISTLVDGSINSSCTKREKVVLPQDLVFVLQHATVKGQPLLDAQPHPLLPSLQHYGNRRQVTPWHITCGLLLLTLGLLYAHSRQRLRLLARIWCYTMLGIQTLLGIFFCYLVFFSSLPCTEWNWLLIPFSPLPAMLWRWRNVWARPALVIYVIWCIGTLVLPFIYEDYAYLPLAMAMGLLPWLHNAKLSH